MDPKTCAIILLLGAAPALQSCSGSILGDDGRDSVLIKAGEAVGRSTVGGPIIFDTNIKEKLYDPLAEKCHHLIAAMAPGEPTPPCVRELTEMYQNMGDRHSLRGAR